MPILSTLHSHYSAHTSEFSYQYSQPYTLTAQLTPLNFMLILSPLSMTLPLNFHANTLICKHGLTS